MAPLKRAVKDIAKRAVKDVTLGSLFPKRYRKAIERPMDPRLVVFLETKDDTMPPSMTPLWEYLQARGDWRLRFVSLHQGSSSKAAYERNCLQAIDVLAKARVIVLCDASDLVSCLPLRPQTKVLQLWHGCGAFKKWGRSVGDKKFGNSAADFERHPFYKNLDIVTVSSPEVEWAYREAMMLEDQPEVVKPLGVSRTDVFFDPAFKAQSRAWLKERFPAIGDRKVLLYAPTFRGNVADAKGPDAIDWEWLAKQVADQWAVIVKHHPFVKNPPTIPAKARDFAFLAHATDPIDQLLCTADACITDYSSIVFEYALFERPLAFFAYDIDDYEDWRGFYYDYETMTPGPLLKDTQAIATFLTHTDEASLDEVRAFRERFMASCDGKSTQRVWSAMEELLDDDRV